jgi:hypothetical protein
MEWHLCGVLHSFKHNGVIIPAKICKDGSKYWYENGKLHCFVYDGELLPSIITASGEKLWTDAKGLKQSSIHNNAIMPARILHDGSKYWYKDDKLTCFEHNGELLPSVINFKGVKIWHNVEGKPHSPVFKDKLLPAIIWPDGRKDWCDNGNYDSMLHINERYPSVEFPSGEKHFYESEKFTSFDDGNGPLPAVIFSDNSKLYAIEDQNVKDEFDILLCSFENKDYKLTFRPNGLWPD